MLGDYPGVSETIPRGWGPSRVPLCLRNIQGSWETIPRSWRPSGGASLLATMLGSWGPSLVFRTIWGTSLLGDHCRAWEPSQGPSFLQQHPRMPQMSPSQTHPYPHPHCRAELNPIPTATPRPHTVTPKLPLSPVLFPPSPWGGGGVCAPHISPVLPIPKTPLPSGFDPQKPSGRHQPASPTSIPRPAAIRSLSQRAARPQTGRAGFLHWSPALHKHFGVGGAGSAMTPPYLSIYCYRWCASTGVHWGVFVCDVGMDLMGEGYNLEGEGVYLKGRGVRRCGPSS